MGLHERPQGVCPRRLLFCERPAALLHVQSPTCTFLASLLARQSLEGRAPLQVGSMRHVCPPSCSSGFSVSVRVRMDSQSVPTGVRTCLFRPRLLVGVGHCEGAVTISLSFCAADVTGSLVSCQRRVDAERVRHFHPYSQRSRSYHICDSS